MKLLLAILAAVAMCTAAHACPPDDGVTFYQGAALAAPAYDVGCATCGQQAVFQQQAVYAPAPVLAVAAPVVNYYVPQQQFVQRQFAVQHSYGGAAFVGRARGVHLAPQVVFAPSGRRGGGRFVQRTVTRGRGANGAAAAAAFAIR